MMDRFSCSSTQRRDWLVLLSSVLFLFPFYKAYEYEMLVHATLLLIHMVRIALFALDVRNDFLYNKYTDSSHLLVVLICASVTELYLEDNTVDLVELIVFISPSLMMHLLSTLERSLQYDSFSLHACCHTVTSLSHYAVIVRLRQLFSEETLCRGDTVNN